MEITIIRTDAERGINIAEVNGLRFRTAPNPEGGIIVTDGCGFPIGTVAFNGNRQATARHDRTGVSWEVNGGVRDALLLGAAQLRLIGPLPV